MKNSEFKLATWAAEGNKLLARARKVFITARHEHVQLLADRIPGSTLPDDDPVVVVFAGQYGAGKSTILKVLTGQKDIATGGGITTQSVHPFPWHGLQVVDTPGVHTGVRPDHDALTYQAISEADLLVFVVTNELFDSHLADHFRKLAVDWNKAHEIMLVVNKMQRCAQGNSKASQDIIREDLRKVLAPFSPEQLRTSFIDAASTLASEGETDSDLANALIQKSGFTPFIEGLNSFVQEKGLSGRCTTALYRLEQVVQEAIACDSSGDRDLDALEELMIQRRRALIECKEQLPRTAEALIQLASSQTRQKGRKIADLIHGDADQKSVDQELQDAQAAVQASAEQLGNDLETAIGRDLEGLGKRLEGIAGSELALELTPRLRHRIQEADIDPKTMAGLKRASSISAQLGEFLLRNSFTSKSTGLTGLFKLNQYSGTATHGAVKAIGNFFGKSFKPWEAVKWTRGIANLGRVLGVAGVVLTFVLQVKEDADADQLEKDLRASRTAVRSGFNDAAFELESHYDKSTQACIASVLTPEISCVDKQIKELREMRSERSILYQSLIQLLEETRVMIETIHEADTQALQIP